MRGRPPRRRFRRVPQCGPEAGRFGAGQGFFYADALLSRFGLHAFVQALSEREAGVYGVYAHAFACVRGGEPGAGEHERGVRGAACEMGDRCDFSAGADDVDHRAVAAFAHAFDQRVGDVDVGEEFGLHRVVPRGGGDLVGERALGGASAVDEHFHRAEVTLSGVHRALSLRCVAQVGGDDIDALPGVSFNNADCAASRFSIARDTSVARAPSARNVRAQARPMPLLPPVMMTCLLVSSRFIIAMNDRRNEAIFTLCAASAST